MNFIIIGLFLLFLQIPALSQQGRTIVAKSDVRKVYFKIPEPHLQIVDFRYMDYGVYNNTVPEETVRINFGIQNTGTKSAEEVVVRLTIIGSDLLSEEHIVTDTIGDILPNESIELSLSLSGLSDLNTNPVKFRIFSTEKNGYDAIPYDGELLTGRKPGEDEIIKLPEVFPLNPEKSVKP